MATMISKLTPSLYNASLVLLMILFILTFLVVTELLSIWTVYNDGCQEMKNMYNSVTKREATNQTKKIICGKQWTLLMRRDLNEFSRKRVRTVSNNLKRSNIKCEVTENILISREIDGKDWILRTFSKGGKVKRVGGDEYYVTWTVKSGNSDLTNNDADTTSSFPTAVANVHDLQDGTYELRFIVPPAYHRYSRFSISDLSGIDITGTLSVKQHYTCGVGAISPPLKDNWGDNGATFFNYEAYNVPLPHNLTNFESPNSSDHMDQINLGSYSKVVAVGDSNMKGFFLEDPKHYVPFKHNCVMTTNIAAPLDTQNFPKFKKQISKELQSWKHVENKALILGSAAWNLLKSNVYQNSTFLDHGKAAIDLIRWVRGKYPMVDVYWLSPKCLHIHMVQHSMLHHNIFRYMSNSRSMNLYSIQKYLMEHLSVPFLDVYSATCLSAEYHLDGDGVHYEPQFNRMMLDWFYPVLEKKAAEDV